jgi:TRAP-type transport system periplasmic protein
LSADQRAAVDAASRNTEAELWIALSTRLQENHARMRQNGVTIDSIIEALQSGAATAQQAWCAKSGAVCAEILDAFRSGKP